MDNEEQSRSNPDRENSRTNTRHNGETSDPTNRDPLQTLTARLEEAELDTERFIDVEDGRKQSYDHTQRGPDAVDGNYGVYTGGELVAFDIDDFSAVTSRIEDLPETFTVSTPHGGQHRYFRGAQEVFGAIMAASGGSQSPTFPWGELYTSKYLVGPGSELTECGKSNCGGCKPIRPGKYEIETDRPIATVSVEEVAALFQQGPERPADGGRQGSIVEFSDNPPLLPTAQPQTPPRESDDVPPPVQHKLTATGFESQDRARVWYILLKLSEDGYGEGAEVVRILDRAEASGVDRFRASEMLMSWLEQGGIRKSDERNRVVPEWRGWRA